MNNYSEASIRYCNMLAPDSLNFEKPKSLDLSNQLAANSTTESESVDVEWIRHKSPPSRLVSHVYDE